MENHLVRLCLKTFRKYTFLFWKRKELGQSIVTWTVCDKCSLLDKQDCLRWSNIYINGRPLTNGDKTVGLLKWIKNSASENGSAHWAVEARIRREDGIFPLEQQSPEWAKIKLPMSHKWLATIDKYGILPTLSSYLSFNTWNEEFSLNH